MKIIIPQNWPTWISTVVQVLVGFLREELKEPHAETVTIGTDLITDHEVIGTYNVTTKTVMTDAGNMQKFIKSLQWGHFRSDQHLLMELVRVLGHELGHSCGNNEEEAVATGTRLLGKFFKKYTAPTQNLEGITEFCGGRHITPINCVCYALETGMMFRTLRELVYHVEFNHEVWPEPCERIDQIGELVDTRIEPTTQAIIKKMAEELVEKMTVRPEVEDPKVDEWDVPCFMEETAPQTVVNPPAAPTSPPPPVTIPMTTTTLNAYSQDSKESIAQRVAIRETFAAIMLRCHNHIVEKCGWGADGKILFPANVVESISIADIPGWDILKEIDSGDELGRPSHRKVDNGQINGIIFNKSGLPAYVLYFEVMGKKCKRTLVPQNPVSESWSGRKAREGSKISWIIDGDITDQEIEAIRAAGGKASKFKYNIIDGKLRAL